MFEQAVRNIDDVLLKEAGCTTELDYMRQFSRLLLLKYFDSLKEGKARSKNMGNAGRNGDVVQLHTLAAANQPLAWVRKQEALKKTLLREVFAGEL